MNYYTPINIIKNESEKINYWTFINSIKMSQKVLIMDKKKLVIRQCSILYKINPKNSGQLYKNDAERSIIRLESASLKRTQKEPIL